MLERYEPAPFAPTGLVNVPALSFSPDGRQLLLMWNPSAEGEQAWLLPYPPNPDHPPRRILETLPTYPGTPQFSWLPDNRHIVVSAAERGEPWRLYLADTESGRFRPLSDGPSTALQVGPARVSRRRAARFQRSGSEPRHRDDERSHGRGVPTDRHESCRGDAGVGGGRQGPRLRDRSQR